MKFEKRELQTLIAGLLLSAIIFVFSLQQPADVATSVAFVTTCIIGLLAHSRRLVVFFLFLSIALVFVEATLSAEGIIALLSTTNSMIALFTIASVGGVCYLSITEQDRMTEQLREAAEVDALTQLFNRRVMMRDLDMLISQAVRYSYPLAVLLMDLDNFKKVNDQHGHLVGDEILRVMARVCSNVVRDSDVLCRYGGEEFAVVCPNTDVNGALVLAERIRAHVANQDFVVSGETHRVTLSIGVGTLSAKCATKEALLKEADDCMYRAKKEGKNRVRSIGMSSQQQTG